MDPGDSAILTHLRRGALEHCVLALLDGEPMYGLDIARRLGEDEVLLAGEGTLYPLLSRLRKQGLVDTSWVESPSGPPRRYYELTPTGEVALATFRRTWKSFRDAVDTTLEGGPR
ncbi:PadR family transcriptional regulator [Phycicoccus sp. CSK15P-2]|uniref:PadR family transcriptional regulator n=1 Tax=Phycicoccus sp. CSK15P-2 TaxID=2807627 RepID=UPI001950BB96|nr:PadR family transcriptional regulator [Phycicoccus sp. CSK15P-2]MBM6403027.1 PadR family transcriptional regulator [Phycicoccus sp. CSK15P-2]